MPEAPEVTYLKDYLNSKVQNEKLHDITILRGRYKNHGPPANFGEFKSQLPLRCISVSKKGKVLFFAFEKGWYLISKLGMTGWWFMEGDEPRWRSANMANVIFNFGSKLIYTDFRNFGTMQFTKDLEHIRREHAVLAPDLLASDTTLKDIQTRVERLSAKSKQRLLEDAIVDQKLIFSGIGNYLKAEVLYASRISPLRKIADVSPAEWKCIYSNARKIMRKMYTAVKNKDTQRYMDTMNVYQKTKDPLGNVVQQHTTIKGRTTFWVPAVQK